MITNVLLTGYTEFISDEFLAEAFPNCRVLITGKPHAKTSAKNRVTVIRDADDPETLKKLFSAYEFDEFVFFSQSAAPFSQIDGQELTRLNQVLDICGSDVKAVYVSGPTHPAGTGLSVLEASAQELCRRHSMGTGGINVVVSPWIYSLEAGQSSIQELFTPGLHRLGFSAEQEMSFLSSEDLALLLYRIFENWEYSLAPYFIPNTFVFTAEQLAAEIKQEAGREKIEFRFSDALPYPLPSEQSRTLKARYNWYPVYSFMKDLPQIAQNNKNVSRGPLRELWQKLEKQVILIRFAELLFGALLVEIILKVSNISVQFNMLDYRLLFIVIIGTMYNMTMGLLAAAVESISLVAAYAADGTSWMNLFYDPTNWLPFIGYFTVGAVCGYIRSKDLNLLKYSKEETDSVTQRYDYLQQINVDVLQEKQEYKQQIISSRDSFGKIFDIVQQLNDSHPQHLMGKALDVVETVMSSNSVAIFNTYGQRAYGRLAVSSAGTFIPNSMPLGDCYEALGTVGEGEAWVNRALDPKMPSYLYGVRRNGIIEVIIMLQKTEFDQMTLYYENLFRVICGLISNSLVKALDYQAALHREKCVEGTENMLLKPYFIEELSVAVNMKEEKKASHVLLRIHNAWPTVSQAEQDISKCVRASDIIGACDNDFCLLLLQASENDIPIIRKRFDQSGIPFELVSDDEQRIMLKASVET